MTQEIEIEFKNLLTKDEFNLLLDVLPFPKESQSQTNHYFETADFSLRKKSAALRIREKNGHYTFTLKEPHTDGLLETHDSLTKEEALNCFAGYIVAKTHTNKQLQGLNISTDDLHYYGSLTTKRREVMYDGVCIVLDESFYNDHIDYEFELEAPDFDTGQKKFYDLLKKHRIMIRDTPNKIERFFATR